MHKIDYIALFIAIILLALTLYLSFKNTAMKNVELNYVCYHVDQMTLFVFYDNADNPSILFECEGTISKIKKCVIEHKMIYRKNERINLNPIINKGCVL